VTTILDPDEASAEELAVAYSKRWEIESAFDELKTHQRGPRTVLRSKSSELGGATVGEAGLGPSQVIL